MLILYQDPQIDDDINLKEKEPTTDKPQPANNFIGSSQFFAGTVC